MPALRQLTRFLIAVVVVGVLVNFASDYLGDRFPVAQRFAVQLAAIVLTLWVLYVLSRVALAHVREGRFAVEALILNSHDQLLVYLHPFHRRMLPPGGRVGRGEVPNEALELRLMERLGLAPGDYDYEPKFHHGLTGFNVGNLGAVERYPAPFLVQRESHRQRSLVTYHYDFIYVLRLKDDAVRLRVNPENAPAHFVDKDAVRDMVAQHRTFPDVLDAYSRVLQVLSGGVP